MIAGISLRQVVTQIGSNLGTDWRNVSPDRKHRDSIVWEMSASVWLHVLQAVKSGHLLAFIASKNGPVLLHRNVWPDVSSLQDTKTSTFASLRSGQVFTFNYETADSTYVKSQAESFTGDLFVDQHSAHIFQALFKLQEFHQCQSEKWKTVGLLGELPALLLGDLLSEWAQSEGIDLIPMRKTIIASLKRREQSLPKRQAWLTPYAVFKDEGSLVDPDHVENMERWVSNGDAELERHWTDSWVVGREWLRKFCKLDPANRPFPAFWEKPTPLPQILLELKTRPSPLKGRKYQGKEERNKEWLSLAQAIKKRNPAMSKSAVYRQVSKNRGLKEKSETIKRTLDRHYPCWDKKVGQS